MNTPRLREGLEVRTHTLKCWPAYFQQTWDNMKLFELRRNDRPPGFFVGDKLILREWEPTRNFYTGRSIDCEITCVVNEGPWLAPGFSALGLQRLVCWEVWWPTPDGGLPAVPA